MERPLLRPAQLRLTEHGLRILQGAGLPEPESAHVFRLLFTFVLGSVAFAAQDGESPRAALARLDPAQFPAVRATADALVATIDDEATFHYGLELILDGVAARLECH